MNYSKSDSDEKQLSETLNEDNEVRQSIDQISDSETKNTSVRDGVSFSEPLNENTHLSIGYNIDEGSNTYNELNELTTNRFKNSTL